MDLPLPNDKFKGGIIVASCWLNDSALWFPDDENDLLGLVILLNPNSPYYTVGQINSVGGGLWQWVDDRNHMNINYAVEDFAQSGGDV
jgi:hypothetical protein